MSLFTSPNFALLERSLKTPITSITPLAGDASTRRYFRIHCPNESFILCVYEKFETHKDFVFAKKFLQDQGIPVPQIKEVLPSLSALLLEDLGNKDLASLMHTAPNEAAPLYPMALSLVLRIETLSPAKSPLLQRSLGLDRLLFEQDYFLLYFIHHFLRNPLSRKDTHTLEEMLSALTHSASRIPYRPAHRDFHSKNLLYHNEQLYMIDFQDLCLAPAYYDLVSLLYDPYVSSEHLPPLLLETYEKQRAEKIDISSFRLVAIQRLLKAVGTYAGQWYLSGKRDYLPFIEPALKRAQELCRKSDLNLEGWIGKWLTLLP